jgi:hypothetical protein
MGNNYNNNLLESPAAEDVLLEGSSQVHLSRKRPRLSLQSTQQLHHDMTSRNTEIPNESIADVDECTLQLDVENAKSDKHDISY